LSGSIGKGLAKIMDRTLAAQGFDREFIEKAVSVRRTAS
jgi:hypothetical protein